MSSIHLSKTVLIASFCLLQAPAIFAAKEVVHSKKINRMAQISKNRQIESDLQSPLFQVKGEERYRVAFKKVGTQKKIIVYEKMDSGWVEVSNRPLRSKTLFNAVFKNKKQIQKKEQEILSAHKHEIDLLEKRLSLYGIDAQTSPRAIKNLEAITEKYTKKRESLWLSSNSEIKKDKSGNFILISGRHSYLLAPSTT